MVQMKTAIMIRLLSFMYLLGYCLTDYVFDNYIDQCLNTRYQEEITFARLDSLPLGNFKIEFRDKATFITSKVKCEYHDGVMNGSRYVRRQMGSTGPSFENGKLMYNVVLVFDKLELHYKVDGKYGKIPKVRDNNCKAKLDPINVHLKIGRLSMSNLFNFESLKAESLRNCDTKYTGLGSVLNKVFNLVKKYDKESIDAQIQSAFAGPIRMALERALSKCPYPQTNIQQPQYPQVQGSGSNPAQPQYPQNQGSWPNAAQPQNPQTWSNAQPHFQPQVQPQGQAWNPQYPRYQDIERQVQPQQPFGKK